LKHLQGDPVAERKNNIIALRRERGWSQIELADKLSTTQQSVSRMEKGHSGLGEARVKQLTQLFGVSPAALFEDSLSSDEDELVALFQKMDDGQRAAVLTLARTMVEPEAADS